MKKKPLKVLATLTIAGTLLVTPYTFNTKHLLDQVTTKAEEPVFDNPIETVTIVSDSKDIKDTVEEVVDSSDLVVDAAQQNINENSLSVNAVKADDVENKEDVIDNSTAVAAPIEDVKNNEDVQAFMEDSLEEGKTVYLYGDVDNEGFKEALNITDDISVDAGDGKGEITIDDIEEEAGDKTSLNESGSMESAETETIVGDEKNTEAPVGEEPVVDETPLLETDFLEEEEGPVYGDTAGAEENPEINSTLIGYSLDENKDIQYTNITISNYNDEGEIVEPDESVYLKEVLNSESETVEAEKEDLGINQDDNTAFIQKSSADAASTKVKTKYDFEGNAYVRGKWMGSVTVDYKLYKVKGDGSKKYDYFTLRPSVQVEPKKGVGTRKMWLDIDVPANSDHLDVWKPKGNKSGRTFSVSIGAPWSISGSVSFDDNVSIKDLSSLSKDFARWEVSDSKGQSLANEVFNPVATWASTGTYARVTVLAKGYLDVPYTGTYTAQTKRFAVSYDY